MNELERLNALTALERGFWEKGLVVAGMDEVGRGPFAGPVVACCVVMPPNPLVEFVNDSKKLAPKKRELVYNDIIVNASAYATGWVDADTIDEIGIVPATKRAFVQAFNKIEAKVSDVLVDAVGDLNISARQYAYIRGDQLSYSIAAASIIAKVERDRYMGKMSEVYPQYGFLDNKGYGTPFHIDKLKEFGPCPIHRRSFINKYLV